MRSIAIFLCMFLVMQSAAAEVNAIIGTGRVGSALGTEFAALGHTIVYGSRNPSTEAVGDLVARTGNGARAKLQTRAAEGADIVVLAVPGLLAGDITKNLGDLSGKIIIDPTNPLNFTAKGVSHGVPTSNGEIIQAAAPGAFVVKAFNVLSWEYMIDPTSSGGPISIPLAGNSDEAKARVAELVQSLGLHPIDLGSIDQSRWIEGMAILLIHNNFTPLPAFNFHLREVQ
jgi:8-hydroxy-5-deazaflavin:NADPH oxidoreductase